MDQNMASHFFWKELQKVQFDDFRILPCPTVVTDAQLSSLVQDFCFINLD